MKNSNDTIGNRTRGLPACSAVPQPTAPLRIPPPPKIQMISLLHVSPGVSPRHVLHIAKLSSVDSISNLGLAYMRPIILQNCFGNTI